MKKKYIVETIEHWSIEVEAESKQEAYDLVNDGEEGERTLTMFSTESVHDITTNQKEN